MSAVCLTAASAAAGSCLRALHTNNNNVRTSRQRAASVQRRDARARCGAGALCGLTRPAHQGWGVARVRGHLRLATSGGGSGGGANSRAKGTFLKRSHGGEAVVGPVPEEEGGGEDEAAAAAGLSPSPEPAGAAPNHKVSSSARRISWIHAAGARSEYDLHVVLLKPSPPPMPSQMFVARRELSWLAV